MEWIMILVDNIHHCLDNIRDWIGMSFCMGQFKIKLDAPMPPQWHCQDLGGWHAGQAAPLLRWPLVAPKGGWP